jgi:hypothetical protein
MSLKSRLPTQRAGKFKNKDGILNHRLSLSLGLLENAAEFLRFGLQFCNHSEVNLLLPYPEIHGLRFGNKATLQESEWYTDSLIHASWAGFTLGPGHNKSIEYRVRPTHVESPPYDLAEDNVLRITNYRWCVDLPSGEYLVWYNFSVGEDYFCPVSHYRFADLRREAESTQAIVWTGEVMSNRVQLVRAEPGDVPAHDDN